MNEHADEHGDYNRHMYFSLVWAVKLIYIVSKSNFFISGHADEHVGFKELTCVVLHER